MSWATDVSICVLGAEAKDKLVTGWNGLNLLAIPTTGWSIQTDTPKHGAAYIRCANDGTQGAMPTGIDSGWIFMDMYGGVEDPPQSRIWQGWFRLGAHQSAAFPLLVGMQTPLVPPVGALIWAIEVGYGNGNTGKLRLVKGPWATRTALTGWTASALTSDWKHLMIVFDTETLGVTDCWLAVLIEGSEDIAQDVGAYSQFYPAGGQSYVRWLPAVVNGGCVVDIDDVGSVHNQAVSNSPPHVQRVPRPIEYWQKPTGDTVGGTWLNQAGGAASYANWDDLGNNGDTDYNYAALTNKTILCTMQTRAQVGIGLTDTILSGNYSCRWVAITKHTTGTKFKGYADLLLGANNTLTPVPTPSTSYALQDIYLGRPGTGAWTPADLDSLQAGAATGGTDHDKDWRITQQGCQWAAYSELNPLTTTPSLPATTSTSQASII